MYKIIKSFGTVTKHANKLENLRKDKKGGSFTSPWASLEGAGGSGEEREMGRA